MKKAIEDATREFERAKKKLTAAIRRCECPKMDGEVVIKYWSNVNVKLRATKLAN